ncbi:sigma-54-dependent Fis family transcriptional regulator [Marinithermofilum abyssi]|uniref:Sigma-54-dependent Fis family transcriptional regulator n=1 Tax=Marinithermofilum abyssi TaxID=1571185 RepID=A0A8J2VI53_9BACL|nr:sigma-54-dependent Fis family transcriptional regulator [Marinithermofilum abyssi]GGE27568.1 sigma-54-dependent Fis family transcriptional regulator [Marinithermofilum abyssi]
MRLTKATWKRFVQEGTLDANRMEKVIQESWSRCKALEINPFREATDIVLTPKELEKRRNRLDVLITEAKLLIKELKAFLHEHEMIALFIDQDGFILTQEGYPRTLEKAKKMRFLPGAKWTEECIGTNAIGTALNTKKALYVEGFQHFTVSSHDWCCAAAPIKTASGDLIAVLDVSGPVEKAHPYLLGIVTTMAASLEEKIKQRFHLLPELNECFEDPIFEGVTGTSETFKKALELSKKAAFVSYPVSIQGESGTGKELVAKYIHRLSSRATGPFVALNCGAIPSHLVESELFGYEEGAFTGAKRGGYIGKLRSAHKGTIFLDEVAELSPDLQVALLRFLQEQTVRPVGSNKEYQVDTRVITATHENLKELVREGKFREDLFYRLFVLPIQLPPLRERKEDIPYLAHYFFHLFGIQKKLTQESLDVLFQYDWPGNIRELKNVLIAASVFVDEEIISPLTLMQIIKERSIEPDATTLLPIESRNKALRHALEQTHGNISKAAKMLGISRTTLYRWLKEQK